MRSFRAQLWVALAGAIGAAACGTEVVAIGGGGGDGGAGGADTGGAGPTGGGSTTVSQGGFGSYDPGGWESTECFAWPPEPGVGGAGGAAGGEGGGDFDPLACPPKGEALQYMSSDLMYCAASVSSEGELADGVCCYTVYQECGVGRPLLGADGRAVTARRARSAAWTDGGLAPALDGLSADQRAALALRWRRDAFLEHASVASFGRFALELLAVGAPPALVEAAHAAALDEVRHARRCFDLARAYGGEAIDAGPIELGAAMAISSDPAEIARRAVVEGCVGETLAAVLAAEQHAWATDAVVRDTLAMIAADEARHAELAWRAVAWLIERGKAPVRRAVREAFAEALGTGQVQAAERTQVAGHGLLSVEIEREVVRSTLAQLVAPLAAKLA